MPMRFRFQYSSGSNLGFSVERLADGLFFDFATSGSTAQTFCSTPTQQIMPVTEGAGVLLGSYNYTITNTPATVFTDGDYALRIHNIASADMVVGLIGDVMYNGDDEPVFPSGAGVDPLTEVVPGSYASDSAGAAIGQIPTVATGVSSIQETLAALLGTPQIGTTPAVIIPGQSVAAFDIPTGVDSTIQLTLYDDVGQVVSGFTSADPLSAVVWAGQTTAPLFSPVAAWVSPSLGQISVTFAGSQTAGLTAGTYRCRVTCQPLGTSQTLLFWDGAVKFSTSPGATLPPPVYCQYQDMLDHAPFLEDIYDARRNIDGYLNERGRARKWLDIILIRNFRGGSASIFGNDPGGGFDGQFGARRTAIYSPYATGQLADNLLLLNDDVVRTNAFYAIALVCLAQVTRSSGEIFATRARSYRAMARDLLFSTTYMLDMDGDGIGDIGITPGTTNTLWA